MRTLTHWRGESYTCAYDWAEDCFCQFGSGGIVFDSLEDAFSSPADTVATVLNPEHATPPSAFYVTAFFEAFPTTPKTFIRGEGETVLEAETAAWNKLQAYLICSGPNGHEFEARGYENGGGFCKHCNMFSSDVIPPIHACRNCGILAWGGKDIDGRVWCKDCWEHMPDDLMTDLDKGMRASMKRMREHLAELEIG